MHNNTKSQYCGRNGWSNRVLTSYSEVGTWKLNTCVSRPGKDASNVIECQLSEKIENQDDVSWQPNNFREIPQLRNTNPKVSENCLQKPKQSPKHYKNAARNSSTSENAIFISFGISFPKLRNPSRDESLEVTAYPLVGQAMTNLIEQKYRRCGDFRVALRMIGIQDPKSGYHYADWVSIETPLMTKPLKWWKMGFLTPLVHSSPLVRSSKICVPKMHWGDRRYRGETFVIQSRQRSATAKHATNLPMIGPSLCWCY